MKRKSIALLLLCVVLLLLLLGCQEKDQSHHLTVYVDVAHENIAYAARTTMLTEYPDLEMDIRSFDSLDDYRLVLQTEMAAGKGPDVLIFFPDTFVDLYKTMDAGVLQDLNPWFDQDPDLSELALNDAVFDGCAYKGQRLYMPLSYFSYSVFTTEKIARDLGISFSDTPTYAEWHDAVLKATEKWEGQNKLVLRIMLDHVKTRYATLFGIEPFVPDTKELLIDGDAFRQALEMYKIFYPIDPDWFVPSLELWKSQDLIFGLEISYQSRLYGMIQDLRSEKPITFRVPSLFEDRPVAYPYIMAAMGSGCKNPEYAYQMIKILLSKEMHKRDFMFNPINQDAMKDVFNHMKAMKSLDISTADALQDLNSVHYMHPFPEPLLEMIDDTMSPWFLDQAEYEVCLENLRNRLEIYINE